MQPAPHSSIAPLKAIKFSTYPLFLSHATALPDRSYGCSRISSLVAGARLPAACSYRLADPGITSSCCVLCSRGSGVRPQKPCTAALFLHRVPPHCGLWATETTCKVARATPAMPTAGEPHVYGANLCVPTTMITTTMMTMITMLEVNSRYRVAAAASITYMQGT
jgi:hypothetical protein